MAIDVATDKLVTPVEAASCLPRQPAPATLWRWCVKGVRGVRLEHVVVGGQRYTTVEAFRRFVQRTTEVSNAQAGIS